MHYTLERGFHMIHSDWHIHSSASYDATLPLEQLIADAKAQGLRGFGITDHLNYNDESFWGNIRESAANFKRLRQEFPGMRLGVELTPISKPLLDHLASGGTRENWVPPIQSEPYAVELPGTKGELMALGVQYAIGAAHWRVDQPNYFLRDSAKAEILEWHRQQMYMACDERVTILGHPWSCNLLWYGDFTIIPASLHDELAAALKENGKFAECNCSMFTGSDTSEYFRNQYAEFMRFLFERGIPITIGTDCHGSSAHNDYPDRRAIYETYLSKVGFKEGDFTDLPDSALWQL